VRGSGRKDRSTSAVEALGRLDENYRVSLALFYLKQFSYNEIAEVLNVHART
jgi:DNA-directed RNA polymerase specialized sigma24 family protein